MSLISRRAPNPAPPTDDDFQNLFAAARMEVRPLAESRRDQIYEAALAESRPKPGSRPWMAAGFAAIPLGTAAACLVLLTLRPDTKAAHVIRPGRSRTVSEAAARQDHPPSQPTSTRLAANRGPARPRSQHGAVPRRRITKMTPRPDRRPRMPAAPRMPEVEFVEAPVVYISSGVDGEETGAAGDSMVQSTPSTEHLDAPDPSPARQVNVPLTIGVAVGDDVGSAQASVTEFGAEGTVETTTCRVSGVPDRKRTTSSITRIDGDRRMALTIMRTQPTEVRSTEDELK